MSTPQAQAHVQAKAVYSSGIQRIVGRMTNNLHCTLCKELFVDPVTAIRCGHTVCLQCYHNWASQQPDLQSPYPCAICSKPFAHLAPDWTVSKMVLAHLDVVTGNIGPQWRTLNVWGDGREAYHNRVAEWDKQKAGIRDSYTHPAGLIRLVAVDPQKD